jgi:hypothetical protein
MVPTTRIGPLLRKTHVFIWALSRQTEKRAARAKIAMMLVRRVIVLMV